jgi:hypothetical protein
MKLGRWAPGRLRLGGGDTARDAYLSRRRVGRRPADPSRPDDA